MGIGVRARIVLATIVGTCLGAIPGVFGFYFEQDVTDRSRYLLIGGGVLGALLGMVSQSTAEIVSSFKHRRRSGGSMTSTSPLEPARSRGPRREPSGSTGCSRRYAISTASRRIRSSRPARSAPTRLASAGTPRRGSMHVRSRG